MKLHFDSDSLREKIPNDPDGEPMAGMIPESRFFIYHGAIHDRKTGKHVAQEYDDPNWRESLLALLQELEEAARTPPQAVDAALQICPNPETQAVAWLIRGPEKGNYTTHFATVLPAEAEQWRQKPDCMVTPLYRTPVEAVPVSALRELEDELRRDSMRASNTDDAAAYVIYREVADRIKAIIRGNK